MASTRVQVVSSTTIVAARAGLEKRARTKTNPRYTHFLA
jgi:hypothetical protein